MSFLLAFAVLALAATPDSIEEPEAWRFMQPEEGSRRGRRGRGRILFSEDPILLQLADDPDFTPNWTEELVPDENGAIDLRNARRSGWLYGEYKSTEDQTVLLKGNGINSLFVNGERFIGDYYGRSMTLIPIPLKQGINRVFVRPGRSRELKLQLGKAEGSCSISPHDALVPDMRAGQLLDGVGAVIILNHTDQLLTDAIIEVGDSELFEKSRHELDPLLPYGLTKPPFTLKQLRQPEENELDEKGIYKLPVTLIHGETSQAVELGMPLRQPEQQYKATKLSKIDDSVQYYAVRPPIDFDAEKDYSLYLTLHGAAVEATGQAAAYSAKTDGYIVAPTNRRPYGFDWQEWGRLDTLETLDVFVSKHKIDPQHIYLTGHSMGGHGAWYVGVLYPDKFAAIGPSAGWISFSSYTRSLISDIEENLLPFEWAQMESDTMGLVQNYTSLPVYILHGEKDNNVPVTEARKMVTELAKFHMNFAYYEQPGAGHWWDNSPDPGAACVDWKPLFDFFRNNKKSQKPLSITFKTPNPAISSSRNWVTIHSQISPSELSSVEANADPKAGTAKISTGNVERLVLELGNIFEQDAVELQIDDTTISASTSEIVCLGKAEDDWKITNAPSPKLKGAHRNGPFKLAFDKHMVWVYGTSGTDEENAAILAKVRYDAQMWWYRGNGTVEIVADKDFNPENFADRNIILFGNADTNSVFGKLLSECPIQMDRNGVKIGQESYPGDMGVFFVYPRPKSDENLIGVIGATTPKAMRMNLQARYFVSGVACPDFVVFSADVLTEGMEGIINSGYFNNEWKLPE